MNKVRLCLLPSFFIFQWALLCVLLPLNTPELRPESAALLRISGLGLLLSHWFLAALGAGWGPDPWILRIPAWTAVATLSWINLVLFGLRSAGSLPAEQDSRMEMVLGPLIAWIVLTGLLLGLRAIRRWKWRVALPATASGLRLPHPRIALRELPIMVAIWGGVGLLLKDSFPWSHLQIAKLGSTREFWAYCGEWALFGAGLVLIAMLAASLTLSRLADWLFYRRPWTLPLLASVVTGTAIVFGLTLAPPQDGIAEVTLTILLMVSPPLSTLLLMGIVGYRLVPRNRPPATAGVLATPTVQPVAAMTHGILVLHRSHWAALAALVLCLGGWVPTGVWHQHRQFLASENLTRNLEDLGAKVGRNEWGAVTSVGFEQTRVTGVNLAQLKGQHALETLNLSDTLIGDADLAQLTGLTHLKRLVLHGTQVTDTGLVHLVGLTNLRSLSLSGTGVTDAGLAHLRSMSALELLQLHDTRITDAGLEHLQTLRKLKWLLLNDTQITDTELIHVTSLTNLQSLSLDNTQISDYGMVWLQPLTGLTHFSAQATHITDRGLVILKELTRLESLILNGNSISDAGVVHLLGLTSLRYLEIKNTEVTDAVLVHLKRLPQLEFLNVEDTGISDTGVAELKQALPNCEIIK